MTKSGQPVALTVLPAKVLWSPTHECFLAPELTLHEFDVVCDTEFPNCMLRIVDCVHFLVSQCDETNVCINPLSRAALRDNNDTALHGPGQRHHTHGAVVLRCDIGEKFVCEDFPRDRRM